MKFVEPHITEKSVTLAKSGKFTLEVDRDLSKYEIKQLVKKLFKVEPTSISVIKIKNRKIVTLRKQDKTKRGLKKAIVTLKAGETLGGYESYLEEEKKAASEGKKK